MMSRFYVFCTLTVVASMCATVYGTDQATRSNEHMNSLSRFKRRSIEDKQRCVSRCINEYATNISNALDLSAADIQTRLYYSPKLFNGDPETLPSLCGGYKPLQDCESECGQYDGKLQTLSTLYGPLEFICIAHYDAFRAAEPCFVKINDEVNTTCNEKCGDKEVIDKQLDGVRNNRSYRESSKFLHEAVYLDTMCSHAQCRAACHQTIMKNTCGYDEQSVLMQSLISQSVGLMVSESRMPEAMPHCSQISYGIFKEDRSHNSGERDSEEENSNEMEIEKHNLEIKVLTREYEKLELEIEILKLQVAKAKSN